jgi:NodT family efflux transporter outer membrane factor (OMF) lipoprotein
MKHVRVCAAALAAFLTACAALPDPSQRPSAPPQWHAPLPHGGDVATLADWWRSFDDPLLPALISQAQTASPTLAQALARVTQARAAQRAAEGARWPAVNASAQASRASNASTGLVATSQASMGGDAQWEIDLFGGVRHQVASARAGAERARLDWHEARVTLAAEVAQAYVGLRACEALAAVFELEAQSQRTNAELTREKVRVGFEAPANGALADAAAAQTSDRLTAQQAECDVAVKALVLLTTHDEPALRERLAARRATLPQPRAAFAVQALPAGLLVQRPDVAAAEQELVGAAADVGVAEAARWPRLTFSGSIAAGAVRIAGDTTEASTWGFGPSLVLPLFDGGRLKARSDAARARYDEARAGLEQRMRVAVREVEEALVRVNAADRREADALRAAQGFREFFAAAESRWRIGAGSVLEMEDARRTALTAQAGLIGVQRDRVAAWIALYRAVGGGWSPQDEMASR